ncbi:MAG: hypothetical protein JO328_21915 [Hyphomicrobiales bacterium]|nr:hypothetical protein [Hyphomicrobiales bacterium]
MPKLATAAKFRAQAARVQPHLYEIPIKTNGLPSRTHTPRRAVNAPNPRLTVARELPGEENPMLDLIMLALGLGFFALTVGYAYACDRL